MASPPPHMCGFCNEPNRWPTLCPGSPADSFCLDEIAGRHESDDHRRCGEDCARFAFMAEVASRGSDHARSEGRAYAVVNTFATPWEFAAFDSTQQAKPYRQRVGRAVVGSEAMTIAFKVRVFVVSADGTVV